jgi:hypothetical protein
MCPCLWRAHELADQLKVAEARSDPQVHRFPAQQPGDFAVAAEDRRD